MNRTLPRWLAALAVLFAMSAMPLSAMAISYTVSVDTSALVGSDAVVAFQFGPGVDSPSATATIDAFTGATAAGAAIPEPLTLGTSFSFLLSFTGNVPPGNDGSFFGLSFFDNTPKLNPLLTEDPAGLLLRIDLFPGQTPELTDLSLTSVSIAVIPEPGTYALMLAGLLVLVAGGRGLGFQSRRRLDNSSLRYA
jgi:hypothetical protein